MAYIAALLADIGKIILMSLQTDTIKKIKKISGLKNELKIDLLEEISIGINHSYIAALICKKWNFSEPLTKTIELHRRPHRAEPGLKNLIFIVYLADVMIEIENNNYRFEIADADVLKFFKITKKKKFEEYHSTLKKNYKERLDF
jgi:HD-like signal output (HDOD) protein